MTTPALLAPPSHVTDIITNRHHLIHDINKTIEIPWIAHHIEITTCL